MAVFHIKINSNEENMANGFVTLLKSGTSVLCLKNEEYIINEIAFGALKEHNIVFELVEKR